MLVVVQVDPRTLSYLWSAAVPRFRTFSAHVTGQTSYVVMNTILRQGDWQKCCHCFFVLSILQLMNILYINCHRDRRQRQMEFCEFKASLELMYLVSSRLARATK